MRDLLPVIKASFKDPDYLHMAGKILKIKFGKKVPLFGAADINNVCNLKCKHCYWWLNREDVPDGLAAEQWREIIRNTFKRLHLLQIVVAGGEPTLRPDILEVFNEELPNKFCVVTNATSPLPYFDDQIAYWVSIDGPENVHNFIRGPTYMKIRENVKLFTKQYGQKKIWIATTINSLNYKYVEDIVKEWNDIAYEIAFQFHTPFSMNDPLWLPYGEERNRVIERIIELKKDYNGFVSNTPKQLDMMKGPWGGVGTTPVRCPTWVILALDHMGRVKKPCCIGSGKEDSVKPICERCGLAPYSSVLSLLRMS
jgi:MoaA/NifB/PqqE/SkfB family radical SAM enzyme